MEPARAVAGLLSPADLRRRSLWNAAFRTSPCGFVFGMVGEHSRNAPLVRKNPERLHFPPPCDVVGAMQASSLAPSRRDPWVRSEPHEAPSLGSVAARTDRELCGALDPKHPEAARRALAELYARHAGAILGFLEGVLLDRFAAEDALQETFLAAAHHGRDLRAPSARGWLLRIAANRARDGLRARKRRERRQEEASRSEVQEACEPELLDEELENALQGLPGTERAAVELRFVQELTHAEVADLLGVSLRTAKSWSARGLERLRRALRPLRPSNEEEDRE